MTVAEPSSLVRHFSFSLQTHVRFGAGCRAELPQVVDAQGWKHVGVVVDHGLRDVAAVSSLIEELSTRTELTRVWCEMSEPTYDALDQMRTAFDGRPVDAVIGVGGGSALDAAKAMAVLATNREAAIAYRGFDKFTAPVPPIVAIPTTAGTGSEITPNASFIDSRERRKLGINGEAVRPRFAFLDPELTISCPPRASLSAAADSLVHATEAYVARKTTPLARMFAREGFGRVFNALPAVMEKPANIEMRSEVMLGAFFAGVALMNSGTGPAAAMSYPIGVHHGVPHGIGGATFLPVVAAHNVANGYLDYADLYSVMPDVMPDLSREDAAVQFVNRVRHLWRQLRMPSLRSYGVSLTDIDRLVSETAQMQGALEQNPVAFGVTAIASAFRQQIASPE